MSDFTTDNVLLAFETEIQVLNLASGLASPVSVYSATPPFTEAYTIPPGGPWRCADAGGAWFLSNGNALIFSAHTDVPDKVLGGPLAAAAVAVNESRLFIGGATSLWFASDQWARVFDRWRRMHAGTSVVHDAFGAPNNLVFWSGRGGDSSDKPYVLFLAMLGVFGADMFAEFESDILTAVEAGVIGMRPMTHTGPVMALQGHGQRMNVYGQRGVSALYQIETGEWTETPVIQVGIRGRAAVAGSPTRHVFVDGFGEVWLYQLGEGAARLGYRQWLEHMEPARTIVSHDPLQDEYWISDGSATYLLTPNGLGGPMTTRPTSLLRDHLHRLLGVTRNADEGNKEIGLLSNAHNMFSRESKHATLLQFSMSGVEGEPGAYSTPLSRVDWKSESGHFIPGPSCRVNKDGVSFPSTSFVDGRVALSGWSPNEDARIWDIHLRYNAEGRRYTRGTAPAAGGMTDE